MTLASQIGGSFVLFLACTLSSSAGIGGGGLSLPILIVVFGFEFTNSVVLSLCAVFGNIAAQFCLNYNSRHPEKLSRPLIYWEAISVLLPAQLAGATIGVLIGEMTPSTLLMILALCTLAFAAFKTLLKGISRYTKENVDILVCRPYEVSLLEDDPSSPSEREGVKSMDDFIVTPKLSTVSSKDSSGHSSFSKSGLDEFDITSHQSMDRRLHSYIHETPLEVPWDLIKLLVLLWFINATFLVCMSFYGKCSLAYFLLLLSTYPVLGSAGVCAFVVVKR